MMLKELFQSWFKRHEHKHEGTKMADEVQGAPVDAGSQADPVTVQVQGVVVTPADAPAASYSPESVVLAVGGQDMPPASGDLKDIVAQAIPPYSQHDAFAEKLRHVLRLAEVEVEHVWDEAVALAKKLV